MLTIGRERCNTTMRLWLSAQVLPRTEQHRSEHLHSDDQLNDIGGYVRLLPSLGAAMVSACKLACSSGDTTTVARQQQSLPAWQVTCWQTV